MRGDATPEAAGPSHDLGEVVGRIRSDWRVSWSGEAGCWQVFRRSADLDTARRFTDRAEALRYYLSEASLDAEELARWAKAVDIADHLSS